MINQNKIQLIRERLEKKFQPSYLEVIDDSENHRGHAGYAGGGRHFIIHITASIFSSQSRITSHRQIYSLFDDLIPDQIHALSIKIIV